MRLPQPVLIAGFISLGAISALGNVITPGNCVGGACGGTLDLFNNAPGLFLDSKTVNFTAYDAQGNGLYGGVLRSAVYRNAGGTLDFYYQFASGTGPDSVGRLTMTAFTGFTTNVGYRMDNWDGAGIFVAANQAPLKADRSTSGGTIGFGFGSGSGQINPGEISASLVIRTNAVNYTAGSVTTQNGAVYTTSAFAPTSAVPEPGTYLLMGCGLVALVTLRRRK